jgi:alpha-methylacyl-CoA racemase
MFCGLAGRSGLSLERGANMLGGAAHYYRCYMCADGREIAIGAIEPQFYSELLDRIGARATPGGDQADPLSWEERSAELARIFASKPRDEWCALLEGTDACFAPVLTLQESFAHPHMQARESYVSIGGVTQPAPAPRFSRTPAAIASAADGRSTLARWRAEHDRA